MAHGGACFACLQTQLPMLLRRQSRTAFRVADRDHDGAVRVSKRFRSRIWQIAAKKKEEPALSDVCFLSDWKPPSYEFSKAFAALKAYAIEEDEVAILHLNIRDKMRSDSIRGNTLLPHPFGARKSILVFAEGKLAEDAASAGADFVGGKELIRRVENQEVEFDFCLSSLDFLDNLKHLPRILREKMPHPRRGTATDDLDAAIATFRQGYAYKCGRDAVLKLELGMLSFDTKQIQDNMAVLLKSVMSHRGDKKSVFVNSVFLTSTLGPGYRLRPAVLN